MTATMTACSGADLTLLGAVVFLAGVIFGGCLARLYPYGPRRDREFSRYLRREYGGGEKRQGRHSD